MHDLSMLELATAIRARKVSPMDVTEHMLARIETHDPDIGAYVVVTAERARAQAKTAEEEISGGHWRGNLHGVPIVYKDLFYSYFAPTMAGSSLYREFRPSYSATVLTRLENAGAVTLGKVKTTEHAFTDYHPDVTPPRNPWNPDSWSGASSSGSATATAAGLAYAALGSDTGGSITFPSAVNGLTGLKPTWGRVSRFGVFPLAPTFDHIGPLARSALDCAALLSVMAGADPNDPTALFDPVDDYVSIAQGPISGLRIGMPRYYATKGVDAQVIAALDAAAQIFEEQGCVIHDITFPDWEPAIAAWNTMSAAEAAVAHEHTFPSRKAEYGALFAERLAMGRAISGVDVAKATQARLDFSGRVRKLFEEIDLFLIPAMPITAPTISEWDSATTFSVMDLIRFTAPFDLTGSPSVTFPAGFDRQGMPVALQLVGRHLGEGVLLRAVAAFQRVTAFNRMHPTL